MTTQSDHPTPSEEVRERDIQEYLKLRNATDPIEAFNIFIKRNCPDLYAHFIDSDDNEAEFVRRAIHQAQVAVLEEAKSSRSELQTKLDSPLQQSWKLGGTDEQSFRRGYRYALDQAHAVLDGMIGRLK